MAPSVNTSVNNTTQSSKNTIFQEASSVCNADCNNITENLNVVVSGGSNLGELGIKEKCKAESLCVMKTNLKNQVTQVLNSTQKAQSQAVGKPTGFTWPGFSVNTSVNTLHQSLQNSITQIINNTCDATSSNLIKNVNVYITSDSTVKAVDLSETGDAKSSCAIAASAGNTVSQKGTGKQSATATNGSVIVMVAALAVFALLIAGIFGLGKSKKKKEDSSKSLTSEGKTSKSLTSEGKSSLLNDIKTSISNSSLTKPSNK